MIKIVHLLKKKIIVPFVPFLHKIQAFEQFELKQAIAKKTLAPFEKMSRVVGTITYFFSLQ